MLLNKSYYEFADITRLKISFFPRQNWILTSHTWRHERVHWWITLRRISVMFKISTFGWLLLISQRIMKESHYTFVWSPDNNVTELLSKYVRDANYFLQTLSVSCLIALRDHQLTSWWICTLIMLFSLWVNFALQWRHNEHNSVSNHRRPYCLLNCWFIIKVIIKAPRDWPFGRGIHRWPPVSIWWRHHGLHVSTPVFFDSYMQMKPIMNIPIYLKWFSKQVAKWILSI